MNMNLDKLTKIILIFSVLLVTSSVSYYFVIFLPEKEEAKLELQKDKFRLELLETEEAKKEREDNETLLAICLRNAEADYNAMWNAQCERLGKLGLVEWTQTSCFLPSETSDNLNDILKDLKDECFKKYSQK